MYVPTDDRLIKLLCMVFDDFKNQVAGWQHPPFRSLRDCDHYKGVFQAVSWCSVVLLT
jgi:hypothetical protein